jgi:hypothetical protein
MLGLSRAEEKFLIPLLTDLGIATRLDDFFRFVRSQGARLLEKDLIQIRAAFGRSLGTSRWYTTTAQGGSLDKGRSYALFEIRPEQVWRCFPLK